MAVYLPGETVKRLKILAVERDTDLSALVRAAVEAYLKGLSERRR